MLSKQLKIKKIVPRNAVKLRTDKYPQYRTELHQACLTSSGSQHWAFFAHYCSELGDIINYEGDDVKGEYRNDKFVCTAL